MIPIIGAHNSNSCQGPHLDRVTDKCTNQGQMNVSAPGHPEVPERLVCVSCVILFRLNMLEAQVGHLTGAMEHIFNNRNQGEKNGTSESTGSDSEV